MKIHVLESAQEDIIQAAAFNEKQRVGLGSYFQESLFLDLESLHFNVGIHPVFYGFNRMLSKRFPFAVYYRLNADKVFIYTILDCRSKPGNSENSLKNR